ncbi:hypothetical protein BDQ94DRAFT_157864 [Aspergillus welwitschiae]|uniref:Uncharacterized protein n=1 Tax=Aspergillus welwitschiae TaxID=1341132 RepID=A0A3F3QBD0_9EURO|nr:hypothetical protein BDQ94DRAFT_157864 [Aspergillus welwitschiae]RDH36407.1 hypothetical protein BDQ94DRAFT_157864 [Aspergillus welwitschiae]
MTGKENTRGILSLPQELYDEVTLFFANFGLDPKARITRLMCLRLVSVPFNRSATRVLLSAVRLSVGRRLETPQLLHAQSPSSIKPIFTSDLCHSIRYLTVCSSQACTNTVERPYGNLFQCLKRLPSLQYFEIDHNNYYSHPQVDLMLLALKHAHRYLPRLRGIRIISPWSYLKEDGLPRLCRLEGVLRKYLPQLQHIDIEFASCLWFTSGKLENQTFLPLFRLGRGLRSISLEGLWMGANCHKKHKPGRWLHPDAPIERIRLHTMVVPFGVLARLLRYKRTLVSLDIMGVSLSTGKWEDFLPEIDKFPLSYRHISYHGYNVHEIYRFCSMKYYDLVRSDYSELQQKMQALPRRRKMVPRPLARFSEHGLRLH